MTDLAEDVGDKEVSKAVRCIKYTKRRTKAYNNPKYQRGKTTLPTSIDQLQVPSLWFSSADYKHNTTQELKDPKQVASASSWREVICPTKIQNLVCIHNFMYFGKA